ncbi:MAG: hypothetical protein RMX68_028205 [Aulosira sp. ZfuVER01]|nr:hypothetical protein [Aulosira sp. DedVER01a]MDZ8051711.1 hypothetical protein [Aulosira sp. ZfuCHP01]
MLANVLEAIKVAIALPFAIAISVSIKVFYTGNSRSMPSPCHHQR